VPPYAVGLVQLASTPLAVVRRTVKAADLPTVIPECCGYVWKFIRSQNLQGGRHVALYWDQAIRLEVGVEMPGDFVPDRDVVRSSTPAGLAATVTHLGPYAQLAKAHEAIGAWARATGHRLIGPSWEVYGHWREEWNANPAAIRTDIYYQVAPDG